MDLMKVVENEFAQTSELPVFGTGDTISVHYKIKEGNKERTQIFRGVVIQKKGTGLTMTFTIKKMSGTFGVERIFPISSPFLEKIEIHKSAKVRRSRIFYFRELTGKKAHLKEKRR